MFLEKSHNEKKQEKDLFDRRFSAKRQFLSDRDYSGSQKYSQLLVKGAPPPSFKTLLDQGLGPTKTLYRKFETNIPRNETVEIGNEAAQFLGIHKSNILCSAVNTELLC